MAGILPLAPIPDPRRQARRAWVPVLLALLAGAASLVLYQGTRSVAAPAEGAAGGQPRRVKVLFLGDTAGHNPIDRARLAYADMSRRGIDFTYTQDLADLNPQTLSRYDCLLVYANWTRITDDQKKAVLDYVESGHGYAPIHCGSYCFLNSPEMTALTGGRFKSHGNTTFSETIAVPDHPIEKGLKPIESYDESYVHEMHNEQGRTVLGYRVDGEKKEPYTWVRNQGKGRVFYTAWGHDERTWTNENFLNLLERGVKWAAGDWAMQPQPKLAEFTYGDGKLPNYMPRGGQGDLITAVQNPIDPAESMKHMVVPPGFDVKLFASEPSIKKPICMAFDERGRLWVSETFDYPNQLQPAGQGRDQITLCEDTNGDGVADKFTVFADKLSIPTSIVFANGGLIVTAPPYTLFLKDLDGDGKADKPEERKVLFTGWGTGDTHATASNLRWGLDGWVYGTVGYSGFNGTVGGERVRFGSGIFRFKPDGSKLEFLGTTNNNTWGLGLSEDFEVFASTANHNPAFYLGVPNRYYETVRGLTARRPATIADDWHFFSLTEKVRQVDQHGGYTAGAGAALYTARTYPQAYWNRINFVTEPTGHLIGQFIMKPTGSGFTAVNNFNLLASDDEWTAPIAAEVGPDGQVWFIDWYNIVIQHNPIPRGFTAGRGGAYESPLRDKRHGRVYRVVYKDGKPSQTYDLSKASPLQLVDALKSDNMLWRSHAQRLLVERGDKSDAAVNAKLIELASDPSADAVGLNAPAIHALWALADLGALDGTNAAATQAATKALAHKSAGVRKTALMVLPRTPESLAAILAGKLTADREPLVRRAALLAISEMSTTPEAPPAKAAAPAAGGLVPVVFEDAPRLVQAAAPQAKAEDEVGKTLYDVIAGIRDIGPDPALAPGRGGQGQGRRGATTAPAGAAGAAARGAAGARAGGAAAPAGGARAGAPAGRGGANPAPVDTSLFDAAVIAAAKHDAAFLRAAFAANPSKGGNAAAADVQQAPAAANLLPNPSVEDGSGTQPAGWQPRPYGGAGAKAEWASEGRTGKRSLAITATNGVDFGWYAEVPCRPNTEYRLSAWIKTQDVKSISNGLGALLNIHNLQEVKTPALTGTADWRRVEITFNSASETTLGINCLFGGWGQATGTAWYDDIELVPARAAGGLAAALPGSVGRAVTVVANHYARRGPTDSVIATLAAARQADPAMAAVVVDGLAAGWPDAAAPKLSPADATELKAVMAALPPAGKDRLLSLAGRWGVGEMFTAELAAVAKDLQATVANAALDPAKRADAAQRLLVVNDTPEAVALVLKQVNPLAAPDVQTALLEALAGSRSPAVGQALVAQWGTLTPTAQKSALGLLLRREAWTAALVDGLGAGKVNNKDLLPQHWQALANHPDPKVAAQANSLQQASGKTVSADRKAIVDKLMPITTQAGDAAKGKLVFEKNCLVCHAMEGAGGKVGPELTGIGAKPKGDNLIDVLDPNRSVEGTYRLWTARLEDDVIAGKLSGESKTSVEITDAAGKVIVLQRDAIKSLTQSDRSVMPEGFEQLPPQDLTDLLEFLAASKVKH